MCELLDVPGFLQFRKWRGSESRVTQVLLIVKEKKGTSKKIALLTIPGVGFLYGCLEVFMFFL